MEIEYNVQENDKLWTIAEEYLGKGHLYTRILEWNAIPNQNLVVPGTRLKLRIPKQKRPATRETPAPRTFRYKIRGGDTLARLARRYYGSEDDWKRIYEANRASLASPHKLTVGKELTIPNPKRDGEGR